MAGYDYAAGMSNSAVDAYVAGRKPLSRLTLTALRVAGWKETKKLAIALADSGQWRSAEWHHSGGSFYNEIDFFDPDDLVDFWESCDDRRKSELQDTARTGAAGSKWEICSGVRVKGSLTVMLAARKKPRETILVFQKFKRDYNNANHIHVLAGRRRPHSNTRPR